MERLQVLSRHIVQAKGAASAAAPAGCAGNSAQPETIADAVQWILEPSDPRKQRMRMNELIKSSGDELLADGKWPKLSLFDAGVATGHDADVPRKADLERLLRHAERSGSLAALDVLPGPWHDAKTHEERIALLQRVALASAQGYDMFLISHFQKQYGDRGLASNIALPAITAYGVGSGMRKVLVARAFIGDPADAERISRVHVRKEGNFCPLLYDSVIATTDNEAWQAQRRHLTEAFLPLSSLGEILPKSLERAKSCARRLAGASAAGEAVDMSDFLLHEAQAQLQLALLGCSEDFMEATNEGIRATFQGEPGKAEVGSLTTAMTHIMDKATSDTSFALPTEGRPVRAPLSRAVATSAMSGSTSYGNMLIILFAGHDTTGHTMTWLLFELARHPELQRKLHAEVDGFFEGLGGRDPTYRDLAQLEFMNKCITETLRLWPAVPNGSFRQLQFADSVTGHGGSEVMLPAGTAVQVANWPRHRNQELWGADADTFNPYRQFKEQEMARVGCPMAAKNPQSERFSPFAHNPRSCLGRNFAQMEMRLIMLYLLRDYRWELAPPYDKLAGKVLGAFPGVEEFRGANRGTMGPMNIESGEEYEWGLRRTTAMKLFPRLRTTLLPSTQSSAA